MKIIVGYFALLWLSAAPLSSLGQELYYNNSGQRIALIADSDTVLVQESETAASSKISAASKAEIRRPAARRTASKLGVNETDVTFDSLPGWARVRAAAVRAAGSRAKTATLARSSAVRFVTPVLRTTDGSRMSPTSRILVRYRDGQDPSAGFQAIQNGSLISQTEVGHTGIWTIETNLRDGYGVLDLANQISTSPVVQHATPDFIMTLRSQFRPTDPNYAKSWGLRNTGQSVNGFGRTVKGVKGFDMQAESAWNITRGSSNVIVLVMDDGIDLGHPDLNIIAAKDFSGAGTDGSHASEFDRHGTCVAGCIAGKAGNGRGTCGIAPGVRVASAKISIVTDEEGHFQLQASAVINALAWGQSIGARISNSSWGGGSPIPSVDDAFRSTAQAGMLHFVSSGNGADDGAQGINWPSSNPAVVAVGSVSPDGRRTVFSQFGRGLKLLAPGEGIWTTDRRGSVGYASGDYASMNGTSFASPYAAGVAALVLSKFPSLNRDQLLTRLIATCRDMGTPGYDEETGYGMINAYRALGGGAPKDDFGDTLAAARAIKVPASVKGQIGSGWDVDVFKISLGARSAITIKTQSTIDTVGELYDAAGNLLAANDDAPGTLDFELSGNVGAGTYYIAVGGNNPRVTGTYQLLIQASVVTTPTMAVTGAGGQAIADGTSTASTASGTDFGSVASRGGVIQRTFTIRNSGASSLLLSGSPLVEIRGVGAGQFRVSAQPSASISAGNTTTFVIEFAPTSSGASNAMVSISSNDTNTSPYEFAISGTASFPAVADDHGNTYSTATPVAGYSATQGRLEVGGDWDIFRLVIVGYGYINVASTGSTDTVGYIIDSSGNVVNWDDDSGTGSNFAMTQYVVPGVYYIAVRGYDSSTTGSYTLYVY